jgi:ATP-dependent Clp protease ATP-binding subunit ClpC
MATYRFPVLLVGDFAGRFTARLVEDLEAPAGFGATQSDALFQLKEYLDWLFQNQPWRTEPDFNQPTLLGIRVDVWAEYSVEGRIYPCDEAITIRVPCVKGQSSSGLLICSLPTLNIKFFYQDAKKLKELVTHYTREQLRGQPPHVISRFLPLQSVSLDEIVIQNNRKYFNDRHTPEIETLRTVAEPLGDKKLRGRFSRAWERDCEVADLVKRIRLEQANVILVGESGSGKSSVLVAAVRHIEREVKEDHQDLGSGSDHTLYQYWMTSGARLIAGMQYLGEWQARCERLIEELSDINGVLCLDNLLELVRTGTGSGSDSLATFFLPYLQRGELRMITEATPAELDACKRLLPGFVDLFQILPLPQFNREQALSLLNRVATIQAQNQKIEIKSEVSSLTYRLFRRFQPYHAFPGKSVAFVNELFDLALRNRQKRITINDAIAHFVQQTGLPEIFLRDELPLGYDEALEAFRQQVIGQDAACEAAAGLVTTFKAGLNDPQRPLGVLLFCGPTGVGKTELARALAGYFFGHSHLFESHGSNDRLVRLDMSEYAGWSGAQRLLTGPDGEPSELIKRIRRQPFCVLLLDEIEKADADVFDVLLSVFDEGRLTDHYGRVTTFRSSIIIMTSNLGADKLARMGFETRGAPSYSREAMNFFRPEFFNRIDAIVQFNSLSKEMMRQITVKELRQISRREGLQKKNLQLEWTEDLIEHLLATGFDQRYGARPLQRTVESFVVKPLARFLLAHPQLNGITLLLSLDEGRNLRCETR